MKGYRTLIVNGFFALFGVASAFDWTSVLSAQSAGTVMAVFGLANMYLRTITNTPVGEAAKPVVDAE